MDLFSPEGFDGLGPPVGRFHALRASTDEPIIQEILALQRYRIATTRCGHSKMYGDDYLDPCNHGRP